MQQKSILCSGRQGCGLVLRSGSWARILRDGLVLMLYHHRELIYTAMTSACSSIPRQAHFHAAPRNSPFAARFAACRRIARFLLHYLIKGFLGLLFYPRDAMLARSLRQRRVCPSVCPSVCHSRYCVKTVDFRRKVTIGR